MATVYITEFQETSVFTNAVMPVVSPIYAQQTVAIGAGSVQSAAFQPLTRFIRIHTDAPCSINFGVNPTASATTMRLSANSTEYFEVPARGGWKVAVITNT